jgi:hypothetical protein
MARLWNRSAYVILNDLRVEGLRLRFQAKKTLKPDPNKLDLFVYNLAASTRARLQAAEIPIVLVAGYKGEEQVIFAGRSKGVDHVRDGAEWATHIQCGDGEQAFRGHSSFSLGPGAKVSDVLERIAKDLGIEAGDAISKAKRGDFAMAMDSFLQGYTASGKPVRELDRVMKAAGLEWSIQDGKLQILEPETSTTETVFVLSAATGLIGSPDHKVGKKLAAPLEARGEEVDGEIAPDDSKLLLKAQSLLNGAIRPGRRVQIEAVARQGMYRVEEVTHAGDTHGPEWTTALEGRPL